MPPPPAKQPPQRPNPSHPAPRHRLLRPLLDRIDALLWPEGEARGRFWGLRRAGQILERSLVGFWRTRGTSNASALTYTSLLTLVPLLAVVIPMLKAFNLYAPAQTYVMRMIDGMLPDQPVRGARTQQDVLAQLQIKELTTTATLMSALPQPAISTSPHAQLTLYYIFEPYAGGDPARKRTPEESAIIARDAAARLRDGADPTTISRQLMSQARPTGPITVRASNPLFNRSLFNFLNGLGEGSDADRDYNNEWYGKPIAGQNGWLIFRVVKQVDPLRLEIHNFINKVFAIVDSTNLSNLGYFGLLGLLFAVLSLLSKVERAMNDAWEVHRTRPWSRKVFDYMNIVMLFVLLVVSLSATTTGSIRSWLGHREALILWLMLSPYLLIWFAFFLLYKFVPYTRVQWQSAAVGALTAGTLFQFVQVLIVRTHVIVEKYNKIYGVFAILVIVIVLVYMSWCIVLWGMWVCSSHQNLRDWQRRRRLWNNTPAERETLALRLAVLLALPLLDKNEGRHWQEGELADRLCVPLAPLNEIIDLFQRAGVAVRTAEAEAWLLARSPEQLTALDVLRLVRTGDLKIPRNGARELAAQGEQHIRSELAGVTIASLHTLGLEEICTLRL